MKEFIVIENKGIVLTNDLRIIKRVKEIYEFRGNKYLIEVISHQGHSDDFYFDNEEDRNRAYNDILKQMSEKESPQINKIDKMIELLEAILSEIEYIKGDV